MSSCYAVAAWEGPCDQFVSIIVGWAELRVSTGRTAPRMTTRTGRHGNQVGRLLFALDEIAKRSADVNERFYEAFEPYRRAQ